MVPYIAIGGVHSCSATPRSELLALWRLGTAQAEEGGPFTPEQCKALYKWGWEGLVAVMHTAHAALGRRYVGLSGNFEEFDGSADIYAAAAAAGARVGVIKHSQLTQTTLAGIREGIRAGAVNMADRAPV